MNFEAYAFKNLHTKTRSHTVDCVEKAHFHILEKKLHSITLSQKTVPDV